MGVAVRAGLFCINQELVATLSGTACPLVPSLSSTHGPKSSLSEEEARDIPHLTKPNTKHTQAQKTASRGGSSRCDMLHFKRQKKIKRVSASPHWRSVSHSPVLALENDCTRWPHSHQKKVEHAGQGNTVAVIEQESDNHEVKPDHICPHVDQHPPLRTLCTKASSGQVQNGGWSDAGLKRFSKPKSHIVKARAKASNGPWERKIMDSMRTKHGMTERTFELERKKRGESNKKAAPVAIEEVKGSIDDSELDLDNLSDLGEF